jgi:hypothetical protein
VVLDCAKASDTKMKQSNEVAAIFFILKSIKK